MGPPLVVTKKQVACMFGVWLLEMHPRSITERYSLQPYGWMNFLQPSTVVMRMRLFAVLSGRRLPRFLCPQTVVTHCWPGAGRACIACIASMCWWSRALFLHTIAVASHSMQAVLFNPRMLFGKCGYRFHVTWLSRVQVTCRTCDVVWHAPCVMIYVIIDVTWCDMAVTCPCGMLHMSSRDDRDEPTAQVLAHPDP